MWLRRAVVWQSALLAGSAALALGLVAWRLRMPDPRDARLVEEFSKKRESESFHERLRHGDERTFPWPGLSAMQVSWIWLETLAGLHHPESYKGDFSWMFSKLNTIVSVAPANEIQLVSTLAPYFFVIGRDYAGATLIMNEMIRRADKNDWHTWFWSGFHAMDNLVSLKLAGDLIGRAAKAPDAPLYLSSLAVRLEKGQEFLDSRSKREVLEKELDPAFLEKVRKARPDWFE